MDVAICARLKRHSTESMSFQQRTWSLEASAHPTSCGGSRAHQHTRDANVVHTNIIPPSRRLSGISSPIKVRLPALHVVFFKKRSYAERHEHDHYVVASYRRKTVLRNTKTWFALITWWTPRTPSRLRAPLPGSHELQLMQDNTPSLRSLA